MWPRLFAITLLATSSTAALAQPASASAYLRKFDRNADQRVSQAEYVAYMMPGFQRRDRNHDGQLDASEVPRSRHQQLPIRVARYRQNLRDAFTRQDSNHDGHLDAREMAAPPQ